MEEREARKAGFSWYQIKPSALRRPKRLQKVFQSGIQSFEKFRILSL